MLTLSVFLVLLVHMQAAVSEDDMDWNVARHQNLLRLIFWGKKLF